MEAVMPLLQIKDMPTELYEKISRAAQRDNRSVARQTIVLLQNALSITEARMARRKNALREIDAFNIKNTSEFPDPASLIREDRDR
jgi:hypothetical protein